MTRFSAFLREETAAVTVDWVVLTAGVVLMGLVIVTVVRPRVSALASKIAAQVDEASAVLANDN